jgi:DNA-binding NarL/FixJ family response regulator
LRVLLVDNRPVLHMNLIAALEELAPIDVIATASSESQAVALLAAMQPLCDLVVTDVPLAEGSGLGVLLQIRGLQIRSPAIVLTSVATPLIRAKALELGAQRVFDVASEFEQLIDFAQALASSLDASPGTAGHAH